MKGKECVNREKWKEQMPLIMAFMIPLVIALAVCIDHGVYPFGERSILQVDMYHQYCPFFTELMEKIKSGESLLYSFDIGLGADFVTLYAYYLASPLNWLLLLCPKGSVIEFMTILTLLKFALCGLTFAYYLKCHYHVNRLSISIFATAYALSGYMAAYSWNIMWTDCLVLLPLIVLGLERLVKEERCSLYFVTLATAILSNYYIAITICIFLILYFVILFLECRQGKIKAILRFGWYSLLAGGCGAVLIIPEAMILGVTGSGTGSFPKTMEWYFNIMAELSRHLLLSESYTTGRDHWPNLYCGVFVLLFFVLYLLNGGISWKKKLKRVLLVAFFVVSFANNMLDFIWHGFHFPEGLPGRQSFLYIFLLLVLCYEAYLHRKETKLWHVCVALLADFTFLFAGYYGCIQLEVAEGTEAAEAVTEAAEVGIHFLGAGFDRFDMTAIFLCCYALIMVVMVLGNRNMRKLMSLSLFLLMLTEVTVHFDIEGLGTTSRTGYMEGYQDYEYLLSVAKQKELEESKTDAVFYRVEQLERRTKNDSAFYGFPSATQFSSLMNLDVSHIYQRMGMEGGKNFYCYNGATPVFSAMLSVKYILADNASEESPLRTLVAESGDTYLYENNYSLPLGYIVSSDVAENWEYQDHGDITNINNLATLLGTTGSMLEAIPCVNESGVTTIEAEEDGYLYASYGKTDIGSLTEEVSDGRTKDFSKVSHNYVLDLGYVHAGDVVSIKNTSEATLKAQAYRLNLDAVETAYQTLSRQTMQLMKNDTTKIEGTIEVTEPGYLVISIANEDGWTLYVDGKEREPDVFAEAFISTYLEKGEHTIALHYETPGLRLGAVISLGCLFVFFITIFIKRYLAQNLNLLLRI